MEALIFDFDGVIIDTETPDYKTWQEVFKARGVDLDRSLWMRFIGGGVETFDIYQHLQDLAEGRIDRDVVRRERRRRYLDCIEALPVLPGVLDYIQEARELGLKLGVASSSNRAWVEGHLESRGLLGEFESIKGGDEVPNIKPAPDLYLAVSSDLDVRPEAAVAIEDSAHGVAAAKAAGLFCVAVPNPMTTGLSLEGADLRLASLSDISLGALVAKAAHKRPL